MIKISDSEKIFGTAYKSSIVETVILLTKKKIYKNRQNGKVTNIAEIKNETIRLLQYEQHYAEIEGKLPIFEQKWSDSNSHYRIILEIVSHVDVHVHHLKYLSLNP